MLEVEYSDGRQIQHDQGNHAEEHQVVPGDRKRATEAGHGVRVANELEQAQQPQEAKRSYGLKVEGRHQIERRNRQQIDDPVERSHVLQARSGKVKPDAILDRVDERAEDFENPEGLPPEWRQRGQRLERERNEVGDNQDFDGELPSAQRNMVPSGLRVRVHVGTGVRA